MIKKLGDVLAQNLQYDKAEEKYLEAKAVAGKIYFDDGRKSAFEALEKLYEDQKAEKEAEEADRKEQQSQQESGANYVTQGDVAFAQGSYEEARVYYLSAQQLYSDMGDQAQHDAVAEKLRTTEEKIEEKELLKEEAQGYVQEAEDDNDAAPTDNSPGAPADGSSDVPADNGAGTPEELSSGMILE